MRIQHVLFFITLVPSFSAAAGLDIKADYKWKALSYSNLNLQGPSYNRSFMTQNARLGMAFNDLWRSASGNDETIDLGLSLRAIGVAGSTTSLQAPFDRAGANYPNTSFVPFFENAYIRMRNLLGLRWDATLGQQSFRLGSGLLLDDDGAGMAGASTFITFPWQDLKAGLFAFQPRNSQQSANGLMVYGATLEIPTEGTWQINELVEKDKAPRTTASGLPINAATRYFTGTRYQISYGPFVFDGEAALERGYAVPPGPSAANPGGNHILYRGDAEVIKAKWRQPLPGKFGEGIGRITISRGSGDKGGTQTTDEAFLPSHGHRFDGLERDGLGEFFAATPYDALGGNSGSSLNSLPTGLSGIATVGLGFTPPAYRGITLDIDYFLYQADRNNQGPARTLGKEWDIKLRYRLHERVFLQASGAFFSIGPAIGRSSAHRLSLEAAAHF